MDLDRFIEWVRDGEADPARLASKDERHGALELLDAMRYRLGLALLAEYEQEIDAGIKQTEELHRDELGAELLRQKALVEDNRRWWQRNHERTVELWRPIKSE